MADRPSAPRQARMVWWLLVAPMAVAGLLVLAAVVSLSAVRPGLPSPGGLIDACRSLTPRVGRRDGIDLVAVGVGVTVTVRVVSAALVEVRGLRRYRVAMRSARPARAGATDVWVLDDDRPVAFTGGWIRPRIYISAATERSLAADELAVVVAHEDVHRRQRDPLRLAAARVTAQAFAFVPGVARLADRHRRSIELAADETAARTVSPRALAGALYRLGACEDRGSDVGVCGISPERVDRLIGRPTPRPAARHTVAALLGTLAVALVAVEGIESATTAPIDVAVIAVQLCSACGAGLAAAAVVKTFRGALTRPGP